MAVNYIKKSLHTGDKITEAYLTDIENALADSTTQINSNTNDIASQATTIAGHTTSINNLTTGMASKLGTTDIIDNLISTSTSKTLSANQGKVLKGLIDTIQNLLLSDDVSLDTVQEIVTYIKSEKTLIDSITTNKVNVIDIIDVLTSTETGKPLSAKQGKVLKDLIDMLTTEITTARGGKADLNTRLGNIETTISTNTSGLSVLTKQSVYAKKTQTAPKFKGIDLLFSNYSDGTQLDDISDDVLVMNGSASVSSGVLTVSSGAKIDNNGIIVNRNFTHGTILLRLNNPTFCFSFLHNPENNTKLVLYQDATTTVSMNKVVGATLNGSATSYTTANSASDRYIEVKIPSLIVGQIIEIREWLSSGSRPATPNATFTLTASLLSALSAKNCCVGLQTYSYQSSVSNSGLYKELKISYSNEFTNKLLKYYTFNGRWFGRIVNGIEGMSTINMGSEIIAYVTGTAQVTLNYYNVSSTGNEPIIAVSVDDGAYSRYPLGTSNTIQIATGLTSTARHKIKIVVSSIYQADNVWDNALGFIFTGFTLDTNGGVTPYTQTGRRMLFLGDSITAGINAINGTSGSVATGSSEIAYAHLVANYLNAIPIQVGFGGIGMYYGGVSGGGVMSWQDPSPSYKYIFRNVFANDNPDIIIINMGSNDKNNSVTASNFESIYRTAIANIKTLYPNTPIFLINPFTLATGYTSNIQAICSDTADCYYINIDSWTSTGTTTDGLHPNATGHSLVATELVTKVKAVLGDGFFYN